MCSCADLICCWAITIYTRWTYRFCILYAFGNGPRKPDSIQGKLSIWWLRGRFGVSIWSVYEISHRKQENWVVGGVHSRRRMSRFECWQTVQLVRTGPRETELKLNAARKSKKFPELSRQNCQGLKHLKPKTCLSWTVNSENLFQQ